MKVKALCLVAVIAFIASGCASILSKSSYPVSIQSAPSGADFNITDSTGNTIHSGRTPSSVTLKSGAGFFSSATYTVTFSKDGYQDKVATIKSTMDGWYIGNILFGGLIGLLIVDPATGAMWKLPESQSVSLDEILASNTNDKSLKIVSIDDIPKSYRSELVLLN